MTVNYDAIGGNSTANSLAERTATLNITNAVDRIAFLTLLTRPASGTTSSVTLGANSFSLVSTLAWSTSLQCALYVLYASDVGTQTARVATVHSTSFGFLVATFYGVQQTDGYSLQFTGTGSAAATTTVLSTSTTDLVYAAFASGGGNGDMSVTCTGSDVQLNTMVTGNAGRMEHHAWVPPTANSQTVSYALVGGNFQFKFALNIRATTTTPAGSPAIQYLLPLMGVGS